jgi:hypothetical protein
MAVVALFIHAWRTAADPAGLDAPTLLKALAALRNEHNVEVVLLGFGAAGESLAETLQPFLDDASRPSEANGVQHVRFLYRARVGLNSLGATAEAAIASAVVQEGPLVRQSVVGSILSDYTRQAGTASYTFYLLKGSAPSLGPYGYRPDRAGNGSQLCGAVGGWGHTERFLWLDLGATATFGPRLHGGGVLAAATLPRLGAAADVSALAAASLASTVHRTVSRLESAELALNRRPRAVVALVRLCTRGSCDWSSATTSAWRHVMSTLETLTGAPVLLRSKALQEAPTLLAAVAGATKARRVGTRREFWLGSTELSRQLRAATPVNMEAVEGDVPAGSRVLPVYLLDLDTDDALSFDGAHAAVALDDMVLAVQSQAAPISTDLACGSSGPVMRDPSDASCATLYAVLDSVWGALPLSSVRNVATGHTAVDYLWARPACETNLPFYLRDAPARSGALARWEGASDAVATWLARAVEAGVDLGPAGGAHDAEHHWGALMQGLEKASRYMGLHKYAQAEVEVSKAESAAAGLDQHLRALLDRAVFVAKPKYSSV